MSSPEQAHEQARAAVAAKREAGDYPLGETRIEPLREERVTYARLLEWSVIDPDLEQVRSTRRWGGVLTAFKRLLLRLLSQYHAQLLAEQGRFNMNLVRYVRSLEERIEALEQADSEREHGR